MRLSASLMQRCVTSIILGIDNCAPVEEHLHYVGIAESAANGVCPTSLLAFRLEPASNNATTDVGCLAMTAICTAVHSVKSLSSMKRQLLEDRERSRHNPSRQLA